MQSELLSQHRSHQQVRERLWPAQKPRMAESIKVEPVIRAAPVVVVPPIMPAIEHIPPKITIRHIARVVGRHYDVTVDDIMSKSRKQFFVRPRHVVMYLAKTLTGASYPFIGFHMNRRDHTTALHAVRSIEEQVAADDRLADDIEAIKAKLKS